MSRKRKRRGPATGTPQANEAPKDEALTDDDLGIEIVDDVGMLGAPAAHQTETSAPGSGQVGVEAEDPQETTEASTATPESPPEPESEVAKTVGSASVHVVEPLHVSPHENHAGDRNVETLGELLQHAREAKGLSLEEVGARTRIALITLRHLENDRFGELPAEAYVKGFLRSYGLFLGLDVSMLLGRYEKLSGRVSTPVAEIWDEVEVRESRVRIWKPSRRAVALFTGVLVVVALAWVFWSQGAVMLGLRPEGELQQIEMELQREAQDGDTPQAPVTGLEGAELQQEAVVVEESTGKPAAPNKSKAKAEGPKQPVVTEDTAPAVPKVSRKPAPQAKLPAASPPEKPSVTQKPKVKKPVTRVPRKPVKKKTVAKKKPVPAPTPSPEDAAGPPG